jgi:hypothetical protein
MEERRSLVAPFHEAWVMSTCSNEAAWMPLINVPHIPSCPTTLEKNEIKGDSDVR